MLKKALLAFLPLLLLIAIPVAMRQPAARPPANARQLVIITPHNESIRYEFERGFAAWYAARHNGERIDIDWRTPGGTSDIIRYVNDQYSVQFRQHWEAQHGAGSWTKPVAEAFDRAWFDPDDPNAKATDEERAARREFLASNVGIGIDLLFGGGQYDLDDQAQRGHGVDAGLLRMHPEWFADDVIPHTFSGETFYDKGGRYYGTCLSAFGIVYNLDRLALMPDPSPPVSWHDLADPRFFGQTAAADPTKSGSINKCFEMMIQQTMQEAVARHGLGEAELRSKDEATVARVQAALGEGWADGFNLIRRIAANSRYLTDSASKVPHDVAKGDTTAGMCIDFYGRSEAQFTAWQGDGRERVVYRTPAGGSSISVDPILLFRGAPEHDLAVAFIEYTLSEEGQKLWNYRVGTPGGPDTYALRRLPVRRDLYTAAHRQQMSDATAEPFAEAADFVYRGGWTGRYFSLIRVLIRATALDPAPELREAWAAIIQAGGPTAVPEAMAAFERLPFAYSDAGLMAKRLSKKADNFTELDVLKMVRQWSEGSRRNYLEAASLARAGR